MCVQEGVRIGSTLVEDEAADILHIPNNDIATAKEFVREAIYSRSV